MGWFCADEFVAHVASNEQKSASAQTIAICVLAAVAVGYIAIKLIGKLHRQTTERVPELVVQAATLPA